MDKQGTADSHRHQEWIVPRRVMCAFFWVGIILLFTGIILLVTSKHKGGIYQSWGAVLLGLGFCLMLICLILCMHAYCVITVSDDESAAAPRVVSSPQMPQRYGRPILCQPPKPEAIKPVKPVQLYGADRASGKDPKSLFTITEGDEDESDTAPCITTDSKQNHNHGPSRSVNGSVLLPPPPLTSRRASADTAHSSAARPPLSPRRASSIDDARYPATPPSFSPKRNPVDTVRFPPTPDLLSSSRYSAASGQQQQQQQQSPFNSRASLSSPGRDSVESCKDSVTASPVSSKRDSVDSSVGYPDTTPPLSPKRTSAVDESSSAHLDPPPPPFSVVTSVSPTTARDPFEEDVNIPFRSPAYFISPPLAPNTRVTVLRECIPEEDEDGLDEAATAGGGGGEEGEEDYSLVTLNLGETAKLSGSQGQTYGSMGAARLASNTVETRACSRPIITARVTELPRHRSAGDQQGDTIPNGSPPQLQQSSSMYHRQYPVSSVHAYPLSNRPPPSSAPWSQSRLYSDNPSIPGVSGRYGPGRPSQPSSTTRPTRLQYVGPGATDRRPANDSLNGDTVLGPHNHLGPRRLSQPVIVYLSPDQEISESIMSLYDNVNYIRV